MAYTEDTKIKDLTVREFIEVVEEAAHHIKGGDLLTRRALADLFGVSSRTIDRWVAKHDWTKRSASGRKRPKGSKSTVYYSLTEIKQDKELPLRTVRNRRNKDLR